MRVSQNSQRPNGRWKIFLRGHCAAAVMLAAWPVSVLAATDLPSVLGIPVDFAVMLMVTGWHPTEKGRTGVSAPAVTQPK